MNEFSDKTGGRYARAGIRQARHLQRLSHGFGDSQDLRCRGRRGRTFGHRRGLEGIGRSGDFARRGRHDHSGRGGNRRAVHELHKALADVARTGDEQLRGEAVQIIAEATSRLNSLLAADR